jgi:molybdate transport system substrate-binding protein
MQTHPQSRTGRRAVWPLVALLLAGVLGGCEGPAEPQADRPELLVYCGITMVLPMTEIGRVLEREKGVRVVMSQGGSEDLYQALKDSRKGDLYLPGSASFRDQYLGDGLLGDFVELGYNQAALLVPKGNPKGLTADLHQLADPRLSVALCNPESGSIGKETKSILERAGLLKSAFDNTALVATDSRNLNRALKEGDADLILNWRATAFFPENRGHIDVIDLDPALAVPKKLVLNLLAFSPQPEAARRFMEIAASPQGQAIFRRYGFMDKDGKSDPP